MSEADVARHIARQSDRIDARTEAKAGRLLWQGRVGCPFVVDSQGVEHALVRHWQEIAALSSSAEVTGIGRAERMVSVSGSVSPTTAEQID